MVLNMAVHIIKTKSQAIIWVFLSRTTPEHESMNKGKLDFSLYHNQNMKKEKKNRQTESQNKTFVIKKMNIQTESH